MKVLVIALLLVASTFCKPFPYNIMGQYDIGNECQSSPCPRTYSGRYNFACPLSGDNGQIYQSSNYGVYEIYFKTYNMFGSNNEFYASFTNNNIVSDYQTGQSQIQIVLNKGYILNIMPCYNGRATSSVCSIAGDAQLAVWKTDKKGRLCEGCAFSMTRYANYLQEEDITNDDVEDIENSEEYIFERESN